MALFDAFKKKDAAPAPKKEGKQAAKESVKEKAPKVALPKEEKKETVAPVAGMSRGIDLTMVIREPRITEKATMLSERGAYVFDVHQSATKPMIARAVSVKYGVTPMKIRVTRTPGKARQNRMTGATHHTSGVKKAVVYLKKGDKIEFV